MDLQKNIDIIIPIYNAYEDVVRCIDSIQKWTNLDRHRLVLINDCSTDGRIVPYLDHLEDVNCIVIHNKQNKGFSANINIGIAVSKDRDVILLNSDTVVTKHWVEKLLECAYQDPWIATVTPLSNNATLCSVPYFCRENKIPKGYTVDSFAELIEKVSLKKYPVIPVANGYCMFVKREIINKIGGFDAQTFEKGYGEENDFCYRAKTIGYHHVMCDDTFILHTGTQSFVSKEKKKYIAEHEKILDKRYPDLMQEVRVFCRDNPVGIISHNIRMRILLENCKKRKTIMYLLHSDFREDAQDHTGGTQLHVKDLVQGFRKKYNVLVAARNFNYLNVTLYTAKKELFFQFYIGEKPKYEVFRSTRLAAMYGKILEIFKVQCVHVHHVHGVSLELYYEARKRGIPVYTTLHDYYYICPNVTLLDKTNKVCIHKVHTECAKCLKAKKGICEKVDYVNEWRQQHHEVLRMSEKVLVPSESTAKIIDAYYSDLKDRLAVIEHGSSQEYVKAEKVRRSCKKAFHIAFLGAINSAKGFRTAVELVRKGENDIEWYLFGYFERQVPDLERRKNFHNMGAYQREDLPKLFAKYEIDLVCILPVWPESFCYTVSEAVLACVPILATDIGAVGERVRRMDCGWVVPYTASADEILVCIRQIQSNKKEYRKKIGNIRRLHLRTNEEMYMDYDRLYQIETAGGHGEMRDGWDDKVNEWLIGGYLMMDDGSTFSAGTNNRLRAAEWELNVIRQSYSYRIALMLMNIPVPFRKQLKWILTRLKECRKQ